MLFCGYTDDGATDTLATSSMTVIVQSAPANKPARPANTRRPSVSRSRSTLICNRGSWSGSPSRYSYRWLINGHAKKGAQGSKLAVTPPTPRRPESAVQRHGIEFGRFEHSHEFSVHGPLTGHSIPPFVTARRRMGLLVGVGALMALAVGSVPSRAASLDAAGTTIAAFADTNQIPLATQLHGRADDPQAALLHRPAASGQGRCR